MQIQLIIFLDNKQCPAHLDRKYAPHFQPQNVTPSQV